MKKANIIIAYVILVAIIFSGCNSLLPIDKDQFDIGDTVSISIGEKLYENPEIWVRLDSITEDSRCPVDADCFWEGRVVMWFTAHSTWGLQTLTFSSDTCMDNTFLYHANPIDSHFSEYLMTITEVLPIKEGIDPIEDSEYEIKFVISTEMSVDRKPNLYLYPEKKTKMTVTMDFPHGGKVIHSDPLYPVDWKNIKVKPDGKIDKKFDFLFYECEIPDVWQYVEGWVVEQEKLPEFFAQNLKDYGFNDAEIEDFIDWWIPELTEDPYYMILPQYTEMVNQVIKLWITPRPDSIMRLHYVISGSIFDFELPEPEIPEFKAEGFVAREWGVILK